MRHQRPCGCSSPPGSQLAPLPTLIPPWLLTICTRVVDSWSSQMRFDRQEPGLSDKFTHSQRHRPRPARAAQRPYSKSRLSRQQLGNAGGAAQVSTPVGRLLVCSSVQNEQSALDSLEAAGCTVCSPCTLHQSSRGGFQARI